MPSRIPLPIRARIIQFKFRQVSTRQVQNSLAKEGFHYSLSGISRVSRRYFFKGIVRDSRRSGRKSLVHAEHLQLINNELKKNDELTSVDLRKILSEKTGVNLPLSTIKRHRRKLGWVQTGVKYCQLIRLENQALRVKYALESLKKNDKFENVIFTDESSVELDSHAKLTFRKIDDSAPRTLKPKPKHPTKVHVWAGISRRGATTLLIFDGIMRKEFYADTILSKGLKPFITSKFPDGHRFMQDNDPKHTSKYAGEFMTKNGINWVKTPAESPDMNPIEKVWNEMKNYLRKIHKPKVKEELIEGLSLFWSTRMSQKKCSKYISNLRKVVPAVIACGGRATGY